MKEIYATPLSEEVKLDLEQTILENSEESTEGENGTQNPFNW